MFHSPTDENILIQLENLTGISKEEIDKDVVERIKNAIIISDDDIYQFSYSGDYPFCV